MIRDGLWDVYKNVHMGLCGDRCAEEYRFHAPEPGRIRRSELQAGSGGIPKGLLCGRDRAR